MVWFRFSCIVIGSCMSCIRFHSLVMLGPVFQACDLTKRLLPGATHDSLLELIITRMLAERFLVLARARV